MTELLEAIALGDIKKAIALVKKGEDIHSADSNGNTPLHLTAQCEFPYQNTNESSYSILTHVLLEKGANPHRRNNQGNTPLHLTLNTLYFPEMEMLHNESKEIAEILMKRTDLGRKNKDGKTPLYLAIENGYVALAKQLLEIGVGLTLKSNEGITPLNLMLKSEGNEYFEFIRKDIKEYNKNCINHFVQRMNFTVRRAFKNVNPLEGKSDLDDPIVSGLTSLHWAVINNDVRSCIFLMKSKANPNSLDNEGNTPLHLALLLEKKNIAKLLAMVTSVNLKNKEGKSLVECAITAKIDDVVKILFMRKANFSVLSTSGHALHSLVKKEENEDLFSFLHANKENKIVFSFVENKEICVQQRTYYIQEGTMLYHEDGEAIFLLKTRENTQEEKICILEEDILYGFWCQLTCEIINFVKENSNEILLKIAPLVPIPRKRTFEERISETMHKKPHTSFTEPLCKQNRSIYLQSSQHLG